MGELVAPEEGLFAKVTLVLGQFSALEPLMALEGLHVHVALAALDAQIFLISDRSRFAGVTTAKKRQIQVAERPVRRRWWLRCLCWWLMDLVRRVHVNSGAGAGNDVGFAQRRIRVVWKINEFSLMKKKISVMEP